MPLSILEISNRTQFVMVNGTIKTTLGIALGVNGDYRSITYM